MKFFTDEKYQLGTARAEYAEYWHANSDRMPPIALRLSAGMLPLDLFSTTNDPVELHDARIRDTSVSDDHLSITLHGDDNGGLRVIELVYDCSGFEIPAIPTAILADKGYCDLMCHEFQIEPDFYRHQILFANGVELTIQFLKLEANVNPDRDITM